MANTMRKVSLRNLGAHKLRLLLTVLSVVLGTSFVAGSLVFTETVGKSFNDLFDNVAIGVDAQVTSKYESGGVSTDLGIHQSDIDRMQAQKRRLGVDVRVLDGGLRAWVRAGFRLQRSDAAPRRGQISLTDADLEDAELAGGSGHA